MEGIFTGFAIIVTLITAGYLCARLGIGGGRTAEFALNRISFFIAMPALMFTVVSRAHPRHLFGAQLAIQMIVAALAAAAFVLCNRLFLARSGAEATVGAVSAAYVNSNNMGLPIAIFVLGDPTAAVPALLFNLLLLAPITALVLDAQTTGHISWRLVAAQPIRNPLIVGTLLGVWAAWANWTPPVYVWEPLEALGGAAIPMMLMAFGMSLRGAHPLERGTSPRRAALVAATIKSVLMPTMAFLLARYVFDLSAHGVLAAVVVAGLPTAQNVYNYAARYGEGTVLARDVVLLTTAFSPAILLAVAALLG